MTADTLEVVLPSWQFAHIRPTQVLELDCGAMSPVHEVMVAVKTKGGVV